ncbi:DUF945 family protein [Pseudocitrobacter sp. RIT415]|uniref:DUF945 family protein n=1 Tax=Pseudocitrobacter sp. RIT415 TaxID=2202163 RepID=UPI0013142C8E|nr:DUF945 family protein [Pseudocitrobacter sp. RIT 415]
MKKSVVAAGVVVALGVCWMGSAWYTGKQIEPKVADFVSSFNQASKAKSSKNGDDIKLQGIHQRLAEFSFSGGADI